MAIGFLILPLGVLLAVTQTAHTAVLTEAPRGWVAANIEGLAALITIKTVYAAPLILVHTRSRSCRVLSRLERR